ncbi:uncharacterized protein TrAFT101_003463 [Trichoderma asperellum]|uniref:Myb-like domain-containing protein n=1 Tax=Trichoderma asperellum (strain ATCC 204424 / CBS 433.97 / NBRC 101777) TaxID=1042311 RepID=A0A2T3ZQM5_TRIA4|nr:hypothetical protein M441DRAFT_126622 [Trichoderma asperellum CBS 433.97]PTB47099.1 hypothetical protein M441DRAFT_126622 [Trichoderma asperellum CBS 433.97]UKZ87690.1 hypothetical protein TrAFT101_003463 [Trichoderma asperellum]
MLLPSAFSCDGSRAAPTTRSHTGRFVSPPSSPTTLSAQYSIDNIMNTCRSLQSLITMTAPSNDHGALAPAPTLTQLPTPPLAYAPTPMKLRLRARGNKSDSKGDETPVTRKRIAKRTPPAPPRGVNKRRRALDDDMGRSDETDMDTEADLGAEALQMTHSSSPSSSPQAPSTPKRARISPEQLPLGLERSDFHDIHLLEGSANSKDSEKPGTDLQVEADGSEWSLEDDRVLVELVLEKLRLSKTEWQDCARSLGKDRHSVGRRWKSLMMNGDVGVKTRSRRARLHSTWR